MALSVAAFTADAFDRNRFSSRARAGVICSDRMPPDLPTKADPTSFILVSSFINPCAEVVAAFVS